VRLTARLRRQIAEGILAPSMPAPSITALSQEYGHARETCAKALRIVEAEGLLTRIPGLGYYVTGTPTAGEHGPGSGTAVTRGRGMAGQRPNGPSAPATR
jgi:DNA-binding GntR family transcriptional regulator